MSNCKHCNHRFILRHDIPEIRRGAVVEFNSSRERYEVVNLDEVARYPLTLTSRFSFHQDVVENMPYWFELLD